MRRSVRDAIAKCVSRHCDPSETKGSLPWGSRGVAEAKRGTPHAVDGDRQGLGNLSFFKIEGDLPSLPAIKTTSPPHNATTDRGAGGNCRRFEPMTAAAKCTLAVTQAGLGSKSKPLGTASNAEWATL